MISESDLQRAGTTLKTWALDEDLKARVLASPRMAAAAKQIARRYTAGETVSEALSVAEASIARGHGASIDFVGESVRKAELANADTATFVEVATQIAARDLPSTVSFDVTHIGALVDPQLAIDNAMRIATILPQEGTQLVVSAEGSDRTDLVLDIYERLSGAIPNVGITLQAALHRTAFDLERVLQLPGRIRLVKGAFLEGVSIAHQRGDDNLVPAYLELAHRVLEAGHPVSIATHDPDLLAALVQREGDVLRGENVEFEMLLGLGTELLDSLHEEGYFTREYVTFGQDWWLYVLNRMAEHPERIILALADLAGIDATYVP